VEAKQILEQLIDGKDLKFEQASWMMNQFMDGKLTHSQMAGMLTALRIKQETVTEITACAAVMREKATKIPVDDPLIIDTCGTGGDASGSFNISTTVALLLAGGGFKVAKHGNRSMTSKSGSADLLEALGINLNLNPVQVADCIRRANIGFLFAPALHSAMKNVVPVRKELGVRTIFNILGPLTNPAGAHVQIVGLYDSSLVSKIIQVLKELGSKAAYVFSGLSGLDEVCIASNSKVAYLDEKGEITEFIFNPEDYGFKKASIYSIKGGTPQQNADITIGILKGEINGAMSDVVAINAGFAISAAENCSLEQAFGKAQELLAQGVGITAIENLKSLSNSFKL
jgi:anthranilate phosphoribosyltransferase